MVTIWSSACYEKQRKSKRPIKVQETKNSWARSHLHLENKCPVKLKECLLEPKNITKTKLFHMKVPQRQLITIIIIITRSCRNILKAKFSSNMMKMVHLVRRTMASRLLKIYQNNSSSKREAISSWASEMITRW